MTPGPMRPAALALLAVMCVIAASPAGATGTVECRGVEDDAVTAFLSVGRVPGLALLNGRFEANGTFFATDADRHDGALAITYGQGYMDQDRLRADFLDLNALDIVISLRLERAIEGRAYAEAGVLWIKDEGAWAVVCESS